MEELQQRSIATNWTSAANFSSFMTKKVNPLDSTNFAASFISSGTVSPWVTRPNPLNKPSVQPEEELPKKKASVEEFVEAVPGQNAWADAKAQSQQLKRKPEVKAGDDGGLNGLYKTELCRSFSETGTCRYGSKCQFAHGIHELMPVQRHPKYKTEVCKSFHTYGTCPYGTRCRFIHSRPGDLPVAQPPAQGWSTSWTKPADEITPIGAGHKMVAPSTSPVLEPVTPTFKPTATPTLPPAIQVSAPTDPLPPMSQPSDAMPPAVLPVAPVPAPVAIPVPVPAPVQQAPAPPAPVASVPSPVPVPVLPQAPAPVITVTAAVSAVGTPQSTPAVVAPIVLRTDGASDILSLSLQEEELVTATATGEVVIPLNSPQPKKRLPVFQELC